MFVLQLNPNEHGIRNTEDKLMLENLLMLTALQQKIIDFVKEEEQNTD